MPLVRAPPPSPTTTCSRHLPRVECFDRQSSVTPSPHENLPTHCVPRDTERSHHSRSLWYKLGHHARVITAVATRYQVRASRSELPSLRGLSWSSCCPQLSFTRSSSALNSSGCCAHVSFRTGRRTSHRAELRCAHNHCGSSGGSSCVRGRRCSSSHFSSSVSIRRERFFGRQGCQACKQSYSCVGSNS